MSFDPVTKAVEVLRHIEYEVVNGYRVYGFASRLLIHPSGNALFGLAKFGSVLDAGRVFYLNIDPASADYLKFAWVADLGAPDAKGDTFGRSPLAHMQWNDENRIFIANYSRVNATKTNVFELMPSNSADLSQPWVPTSYLTHVLLVNLSTPTVAITSVPMETPFLVQIALRIKPFLMSATAKVQALVPSILTAETAWGYSVGLEITATLFAKESVHRPLC